MSHQPPTPMPPEINACRCLPQSTPTTAGHRNTCRAGHPESSPKALQHMPASNIDFYIRLSPPRPWTYLLGYYTTPPARQLCVCACILGPGKIDNLYATNIRDVREESIFGTKSPAPFSSILFLPQTTTLLQLLLLFISGSTGFSVFRCFNSNFSDDALRILPFRSRANKWHNIFAGVRVFSRTFCRLSLSLSVLLLLVVIDAYLFLFAYPAAAAAAREAFMNENSHAHP